MKRILIIGLLAFAAFLTTLASPALVRAVDDSGGTRVSKTSKKTKSVIVVPEAPDAPHSPELPRAIIVQSESGQVIRLGRDSIYAREISIDPSGIRIVDRNGMQIVLPAHPMGVDGHPDIQELPDNFDVVFDEHGEVRVVQPIDGNRNDQVTQLASNIEVRDDEVVRGDVVCIFCDVDVKGLVTGSAVSVFGNVTVDGKVGNEAVAPFGRIHVGESGHIRSDAFASKIVRDPGGRIDGSRQEFFFNFLGGDEGFGETWTRSTFTIVVSLKILFWLFLVLLGHALAARNITKVKERIQKSYVKSFLMGVLGQILFLPIFVLLLVTIIGIPVAIFVMPLMVFGGLVLAQAAVGQIVGDKIAENTSLPLRTPLSRMVAGVAALQIFAYLTIVFIWPAGQGSSGGAFRLITIVMFALSAIMGYVVLTLGWGSVIMTRFGTRPKEVLPVANDTSGAAGTVPPIAPDVTPLPFDARDARDPGAAPFPG